MSFKFKPEDFSTNDNMDMFRSAKSCASTANRLLDKYLKTLPEVNQPEGYEESQWTTEPTAECFSMRRARLWDAEELEPKKCEHKTISVDGSQHEMPAIKFICLDCKKPMRASFEECE